MKKYNTLKPNSWEKFGKIKELSKKDFEKVCTNSESMAEACSKLGLNFATFKKYALKYGCYKPNQSLKGGKKNIGYRFKLEEVIYKGKYPGYSRKQIKMRLIKEGFKEHKCEKCNLKKWNNVKIPLELEHIDGNGKNHLLKNIKLLCPNCHAQTPTYRGKNK